MIVNIVVRFEKVLKFVLPLVNAIWFDRFEKGFQQYDVVLIWNLF